ncbi:hypothetical protein IFM89_028200 [Coptis chinensis]|uniref:Reverse transcriptase n=1 Tax=Coptis chinensis TaxID=261450 RepID=A0A835HKK2_9MAGN|nr:hypothetical protein IFM89_028200 [Coptis chinensis]
MPIFTNSVIEDVNGNVVLEVTPVNDASIPQAVTTAPQVATTHEVEAIIVKGIEQVVLPVEIPTIATTTMNQDITVANHATTTEIMEKETHMSGTFGHPEIATDIQKQQEDGIFDVQLHLHEMEIEKIISSLMQSEATMWKQRSCIKEELEGERNSTYFHAKARIWQSKSFIEEIRIEDGTRLHDQRQIKEFLVQAYENKFKARPVVHRQRLMDLIPHMVWDLQNASLIAMPTWVEISETVMSMDPSSSPGPDSFQGMFFHKCWNIVCTDVCRAICSFFTDQIIPQGNNKAQTKIAPYGRKPSSKGSHMSVISVDPIDVF